jgi:hypothetical protein
MLQRLWLIDALNTMSLHVDRLHNIRSVFQRTLSRTAKGCSCCLKFFRWKDKANIFLISAAKFLEGNLLLVAAKLFV